MRGKEAGAMVVWRLPPLVVVVVVVGLMLMMIAMVQRMAMK